MKEFEIAKKIGKELTESELQEAAAKAHHGFVNFKPALLQSRIGIVFHF